MIGPLDHLWESFRDEGYEPLMISDFRPWVVVAVDVNSGVFIVVLGETCPSEVYGHAITGLPAGLEMEDHGMVNGSDFMVFG